MSKRNRTNNPWLSRRPETPAAAAATGPRTPEGKAISSQNARVHNLTGDHIVLPHEDANAYERLLKGFMITYRPEDESEKLLVQHAAESQWLILRAARLEAALMTLIATGEDAKPSTPDQRIAAYMLSKPGDALAKALRYRTSAERSFYRATKELASLADIRAQLAETSDQFVSQKTVGQASTPATGLQTRSSDAVPTAPEATPETARAPLPETMAA